MKTDETEKRERLMSNFTSEEHVYLQSQRLGRLATVSEKGELHVVPVTFRYNPHEDSIDIGGHKLWCIRQVHAIFGSTAMPGFLRGR
jgi:hypothetical protein